MEVAGGCQGCAHNKHQKTRRCMHSTAIEPSFIEFGSKQYTCVSLYVEGEVQYTLQPCRLNKEDHGILLLPVCMSVAPLQVLIA